MTSFSYGDATKKSECTLTSDDEKTLRQSAKSVLQATDHNFHAGPHGCCNVSTAVERNRDLLGMLVLVREATGSLAASRRRNSLATAFHQQAKACLPFVVVLKNTGWFAFVPPVSPASPEGRARGQPLQKLI